MFRFNLPPVLLAERPGSFACHCGNTGVERTPNKTQHTKLTLEKKIPPAAPAGIRTRNGARCSTNKLSRLFLLSLHHHDPSIHQHAPSLGAKDGLSIYTRLVHKPLQPLYTSVTTKTKQQKLSRFPLMLLEEHRERFPRLALHTSTISLLTPA